jgi:hypothetical protein
MNTNFKHGNLQFEHTELFYNREENKNLIEIHDYENLVCYKDEISNDELSKYIEYFLNGNKNQIEKIFNYYELT